MSAEWTDEQVNQAAEKLCDLVALADALAAAVEDGRRYLDDFTSALRCVGLYDMANRLDAIARGMNARAYRAARGGA